MAAPQPDAFARVAHRFGLAAKLGGARELLEWDSQTMMPSGGAWTRGEEIAALTEVVADLTGSPAAGEDLAEAEAMAGALEPADRADLIEMRRIFAHASAAPKELLAARARLAQSLRVIWLQAKAQNDYSAFAGPFAELLKVVRQIAAAKADALGTTPYGAMIEEFDPGVTQAMIDPIFDELAGFLPPLLGEARERQASWPAPLPLGGAPKARQVALIQRLAQVVGHSPEYVRIDEAHHPFSTAGAGGDVRFTVRYDEANPRFAIMAALHEAGHAMYEFNLPRALAFRPVGRARGMTVHESQSLSLEMMAGRSRAFLEFLAPLMGETLGGEGPAWSTPNLLRTCRRLDDGFIRVEADEISYPLHVILRYRLEGALLAGDLEADDLPGAWNELFQKLLGRTPPDLARGCLQDIHWASGLFGYFPNYALGETLAAQLFERALADDPAIPAALAQGDFGPYFAWVKPRIHERASLTDIATLVRDATGAALGAEPLKRHLRRRYLEEPVA